MSDRDRPTGLALPEEVRAFLDEPNYSALATVDPDGSPRMAVIWFELEDDGRVLINSLDGRRWPANLRRDPRLSLAVIDREDGERWVGLTGIVDAVTEDQTIAQADIARLARRYDDAEPADRFTTQRRVSFRVRLMAVHEHLDD